MNYQEVAFVLKIPTREVKEFFMSYLNKDKVTLKDLIPINELAYKFGNIVSIDKRYDRLCKFSFYLRECKKSYRNFLNDKQSIKKKRFTGGKTVFYKILSEEELVEIDKNLRFKHKYLYETKGVSKEIS